MGVRTKGSENEGAERYTTFEQGDEMNLKCFDKRKCFAREDGRCALLKHIDYKDGKCPFCKPVRDVTNGVKYPINRQYIGGISK